MTKNNEQMIIDDLKEMIYRLQIECTEKTDNILALGEKCKQLQKENEELKEEIKTKTYHWEQCTEEILKGTKQFVGRMEKAEQTLAEIKEIAESEMDSKEFMAVQCMLNGSVDNKNKVLKQIIQKINEVEDE